MKNFSRKLTVDVQQSQLLIRKVALAKQRQLTIKNKEKSKVMDNLKESIKKAEERDPDRVGKMTNKGVVDYLINHTKNMKVTFLDPKDEICYNNKNDF